MSVVERLGSRIMSMTPEQLEAFLGQRFPTPLAVVATLRRDGSPTLTPVWFRWDGEAFLVWTSETRSWVRNLLRDPRVALSVQTFEPPYPAVVARGLASVESNHDQDILSEIRAITERYVQPGEVDPYIAEWPDLKAIVRIVPDHVSSWSEGGSTTEESHERPE